MDTFAKILTVLAGLGLVAWGADSASKTRKIVGKSMLELSKMTPDDIREEMVNKAVQNAVDREVKKSADKIRLRAESALTEKVNAQVDEAYNSVRDKVQDRTDEALKRVDTAKVTEDILRMADKRISQRVEIKVDDLVDEFKDKIANEFKDRVTDALFYGRRYRW